ncbi:MAG: Dabb family protein [Acidobacteria bacterium]|nr:Dabb family protein [Acidobacteriota bacterium]
MAMRNFSWAMGFLVLVGAPLLFSGCAAETPAAGRQNTLLHIFAYTPLETATEADFEAFKKATADMVDRIPGLRRVWVGKLREPLPVPGDYIRTYGVAMEFDNIEALQVYADHPAHKEWESVYERVRVRGTTTLDILGE